MKIKTVSIIVLVTIVGAILIYILLNVVGVKKDTEKSDMNDDTTNKIIASQNTNDSGKDLFKKKLRKLRVDLFGQNQTAEEKKKIVNKICFLKYSSDTSLFNALMQIICTRFDMVKSFIMKDFNDSQKLCKIVQEIIYILLTEKNADISKEISEIYYECVNYKNPPLNSGNSLHIWCKLFDGISSETEKTKNFFYPVSCLIIIARNHHCTCRINNFNKYMIDYLTIEPGNDVYKSFSNLIRNLSSKIILGNNACEKCFRPIKKIISLEAEFAKYFILEVNRQNLGVGSSFTKIPITLNEELCVKGITYKLAGIVCLPKDTGFRKHTVILKKEGKWLVINESTTQEVKLTDLEITSTAWLLSYQIDEF